MAAIDKRGFVWMNNINLKPNLLLELEGLPQVEDKGGTGSNFQGREGKYFYRSRA